MKIAGKLTTSDWRALRERLLANLGNWKARPEDAELARKFFENRINTRFLGPMYVVQRAGKHVGEGFAMVAMLCMLMEFLETLRQGLIFNPADEINEEYEYNSTKGVFENFLSKRQPFALRFTEKTARDFYFQFRCPLIHEGGTKGRSRILADSGTGELFEINNGVMTIFRNDLRTALDEYCESYLTDLMTHQNLQENFIRKYDHIAMIPE